MQKEIRQYGKKNFLISRYNVPIYTLANLAPIR